MVKYNTTQQKSFAHATILAQLVQLDPDTQALWESIE
jgi:hypothetical protein